MDQDIRLAKKTIDEKKMNWVHAQDLNNTISNTFGVFKLPSFILIDTEGNIVFRGIGLEDKKLLEMKLKGLLKR